MCLCVGGGGLERFHYGFIYYMVLYHTNETQGETYFIFTARNYGLLYNYPLLNLKDLCVFYD